jgi:hypothetical protein
MKRKILEIMGLAHREEEKKRKDREEEKKKHKDREEEMKEKKIKEEVNLHHLRTPLLGQ